MISVHLPVRTNSSSNRGWKDVRCTSRQWHNSIYNSIYIVLFIHSIITMHTHTHTQWWHAAVGDAGLLELSFGHASEANSNIICHYERWFVINSPRGTIMFCVLKRPSPARQSALEASPVCVGVSVCLCESGCVCLPLWLCLWYHQSQRNLAQVNELTHKAGRVRTHPPCLALCWQAFWHRLLPLLPLLPFWLLPGPLKCTVNP